MDGNGYPDSSSDNNSYGNTGGTSSLFNITGRNGALDYYEGYELMNNLNLGTSMWAEGASTTGWVPISNYSATFDGNDHTISNMYININIRNRSAVYAGLFAQVESTAIIRDVGMVDIDIDIDITYSSYSSYSYYSYAGGLVGWNDGGTISGCYATGSVSAFYSTSFSSFIMLVAWWGITMVAR